MQISAEVNTISITGTGFYGHGRKQIKALTESLGFEYNGSLIRDHTTYLIAAPEVVVDSRDTLDAAGSRKLTMAAAWGIPVLHCAWLIDSNAAGRILDIQPYQYQVLTISFREAGSALAPEECSPSEHVRGPLHSVQDSTFPLWSPGMSSSEEARCTQEQNSSSMLRCSPLGYRPVPGIERKCATRSCAGTEAESASSFHPSSARKLPSSGHFSEDEEVVHVSALRSLQRCPKGSTAAAYHQVSTTCLTYFEELYIKINNPTTCLHFKLRDHSHCALVYYADGCCEGERILAYADMLYCYSLGNDIYIEHGYLFDKEDLQQSPKGQAYLAANSIEECELVDTSPVYHSFASVIEGEFWLVDKKQARHSRRAQKHHESDGKLVFFCEKRCN